VNHLQNSTPEGLTRKLKSGLRRCGVSAGLREQEMGHFAQSTSAGI
jgi:hypothetical protein